MKAWIQLFGGEQDGYTVKIDIGPNGTPPGMFYIWRARDNEKLQKLSGIRRVREAQRISVLAYRLDEKQPVSVPGGGGKQYRYSRFADADKPLPNPVV